MIPEPTPCRSGSGGSGDADPLASPRPTRPRGGTSHGPSFDLAFGPEALDAAALAAAHGKRRRPDVAWFLFRREEVLARLHDALVRDTWRPRRCTPVRILHPKRRVVAYVPFEDRVVQRALAEAIGPQILVDVSPHSYGCRPGGGAQRALLALLRLGRRNRFVLHLDIRAFFPSIDLDVLHRLVAERVVDKRIVALVESVDEAGRGFLDAPGLRRFLDLDRDWPPPGQGLPLGAATSQLLAAHLYLAELDRLVRSQLPGVGYVRYVDDLFFLARRRDRLEEARSWVREYLMAARKLRLKHPDAPVRAVAGGFQALGATVRRDEVEPSAEVWRRLGARVGETVRGWQSLEAFTRSVGGSGGTFRFGV